MLGFEDLEGAILVRASLTSSQGQDTTGVFVLDTGAGFLVLDRDLARTLGISDSAAGASGVGLAARPLPRLQVGGLQFDQLSPVLTVNAGVVRRVTGRPVLGLLGQSLLVNRVVVLDYSEGTLVLLPPEAPAEDEGRDSTGHLERTASALAGGGTAGAARPTSGPMASPTPVPASPLELALSAQTVPVPFRLAGDGKMLVRARVVTQRPKRASPPLNLIVDTGATKSVFFAAALDRRAQGWRSWPSLRGLSAPTLTGDASAVLVRVPEIVLEARAPGAARRGVDAAVIRDALREVLSSDVGEPVDGLLGYSFLKHFRIALDYPRGLLWLDPARGDVADRPFEYSHVGIQLVSLGDTARVIAVAQGSPAARAGIRAGDDLTALDGEVLAGLDVVTIARRLEGPPGTPVTLGLRRHGHVWACRLVRERLL